MARKYDHIGHALFSKRQFKEISPDFTSKAKSGERILKWRAGLDLQRAETKAERDALAAQLADKLVKAGIAFNKVMVRESAYTRIFGDDVVTGRGDDIVSVYINPI